LQKGYGYDLSPAEREQLAQQIVRLLGEWEEVVFEYHARQMLKEVFEP